MRDGVFFLRKVWEEVEKAGAAVPAEHSPGMVLDVLLSGERLQSF